MAPYDSRPPSLPPTCAVNAGELGFSEVTTDLRRANQALEQFVYVAAHDLQEPLRMMTSFTELFARRYHDVVDETGQQYLDFARSGAQQMKALLNDLVEYSRVSNDLAPPTPVALADSMAAVEDICRGALEDSSAQLEIGELPEIVGNPRQLRQVFYNLIRNSILYREPARRLQIKVSANRISRGWQIEVSDNGRGVPADYRERVFVVFQRLTRDRSAPGTGMGLPICKKIIEMHGGQIWLDTNRERGTSVFLTFPDQRCEC